MSVNKSIQLEVGQKLKLFDLEFEVVDKIGCGGFSDVWCLRNIKTGSKLVMKCQSSDFQYSSSLTNTTTDELHRRFVQEAETYIEMDTHPNIAYFYGIEKISNQIIIIMEYVPEGSLDKWIKRGKIKGWGILLRIAIQISKALVHAHKYGIIHRDLKPSNILVERDNDSEKMIVKLTDFGLVKILQSKIVETDLSTSEGYVNLGNKNVNGLTISGLVLGTDGYMSPEQERKLDLEIEKDSDIFSFGIVLCELITGKLPFERGFIEQDEMLSEYIKEFFKDHKDCPTALISLITECLRYQPKNRWKNYKVEGEFKYFQTIENHLKSIYLEKVGKEYSEEEMIIQKFDLFVGNEYLPYGFKGLSLLILGRTEKSIKYFDAALEISPNAVEVYNNKGIALKRLQRDNDALDCYDVGIGLDPNFSPLYHNKGISLRTLDKQVAAIEFFNKAIELEPSYSNAIYMKGMCFLDLRRYDRALECFENAIESNPNYAEAYYQQGIVLSQLGEKNDAIKSFDIVLNLEPRSARAYDGMGNVLNEMGEYKKAVECFDKALELEPSNAVIYMNKGVLLGRNQKYVEAIVCFDKALELEPNLYAAHLNKSNALAAQGKYGDAWDSYNKFLALSKEKSNKSNKEYIPQFLSR